MIPYFEIQSFKLGPLTIYTWGFVVSIGIAVAIWVAYKRARRVGLDANKILDLAFWIIVSAFLSARLFHVFAYEWEYYRANLSEIIRIDQGGLSSFGGFIGAAVAFVIFARYKSNTESLPAAQHKDSVLWKYADVLMFAWPLGHAIGRVGCFLTHMHPGRLSSAPWAVQYPGGARLDMGLIESVALLSYWIILVIFDRRYLPSPDLRPSSPLGRGEGEGRYLISGMIFYGTMRFILDFFRATDIAMADARYFGLTPAQYGSIALIFGGVYLSTRVLAKQ